MYHDEVEVRTLLERDGALVGRLLRFGANSAVSSDHILSSSEATDRGVLLIMGDAKASYGVVPRASMISDIVLAGNSGDSDRGDLISGLFGGAFGVVDA